MSDFAQAFSPENTVLIFDWDDTVLPYSWLRAQSIRLNGQPRLAAWQCELLERAATSAAETIHLAKQLGTVVFVTNAEEGWIEWTCRTFMPLLHPSLQEVKLVSARTAYEKTLLCPVEWKVSAFDSELERIFGAEVMECPGSVKNVISIGDGLDEREALLRVARRYPSVRAKSLKIMPNAGIHELIVVQSLVADSLHRVVHSDNNLDLHVEHAAPSGASRRGQNATAAVLFIFILAGFVVALAYGLLQRLDRMDLADDLRSRFPLAHAALSAPSASSDLESLGSFVGRCCACGPVIWLCSRWRAAASAATRVSFPAPTPTTAFSDYEDEWYLVTADAKGHL